MSASIQRLVKRFPTLRGRPDVTALDGIELEARSGELLVVVGPSGSGKTTLLRCIAGLEVPDSGRVEVGGRDVTKSRPGDRDVAMVFQDFALYPHLSARDNVAFGLRARGMDAIEVGGRIEEVARLLGLNGILDRKPGQLSGGERQRVALARAVSRRPALFLLDEPLSNLDAELRARARAEVRKLQRSLGTTCIYVTHDQIEAMTVGDRVAVLRAGRVEQVATPTDLYDHPATAFVARFMGTPPMNLLPGALFPEIGAPVVGVRPENLHLIPADDSRLLVRIEAVEVLGDVVIAHGDLKGHQVLVKLSRDSAPRVGQTLGLAAEAGVLQAFDGPEGKAVP
ncbi:MAG: ABC transporter ATP-binding protein [Actinomycetota bacterium]|nr:ABC transporter ATP-binding protein [Actinomycetota bacterium]